MQVWTTVCGKTALMASGKPFRPSTTAIRMSPTPRVFSSFMTRSQNLAPSVCSIQMPRILLRAVGQDAQRDVDGLVAHETLLPDLDPDRVEKDEGEAGVERSVLPFGHPFQDRVGDGRDQVRRS